MKKSIPVFLLIMILSSSCSIYQKAPVSLVEAKNKGKSKVISTSNNVFHFKSIVESTGNYYGIQSNLDSVRLVPEQISEVYLQKQKLYQVWVRLNYMKEDVRGVLYQINDSSIVVSNSLNIEDYPVGEFEVNEYQINEVQKIRIRRKNQVWKGSGIGATSGLIVSLIIGLDKEDPYTIIGAAAGTILGAVIGAIIGSNQRNLSINRSYENYQNYKSRLREYSIIN